MRIRTIKPEFWRSQDIADLAWEDRLLFIGMWSYVDDNGVGRDDFRIITAELFALDSGDYRDNLARVSDGLDTLAEAGRIVRYTVSGTPFLQIVNWDKHQRIDKPNKPRYPRSDEESAIIRESVARVAETLAPGTGEQGNRGTGDFYSPSKSQSRSNRARVSTDAVVVSEMTRRLAAQKGITSLRAVVDAIHRHTSCTVDADQAYQVAVWILDKAKTYPNAPQRYVTSSIGKSPAEVEQHIFEAVAS